MRINPLSSFGILLSAALASFGLPAGESPRFRVDTREQEFRILNVTSVICSGEYGSSGGHAYLPAHYRGSDVEFTFTVEASEDVVGYVYSDSPTMTSQSNTRRINFAGRSPGFALTVIGVDKDGRKTAPFRVNFDIVDLSFAEALQCVAIEGSKCRYKGSASFDIRNLMASFSVKLPCVEIKGEPKKTEDNTQLGFFGSLHAEYEFSSDGNATLSAGGGDTAKKGDWKKWGKAFGTGIDWSYGGKLTYLHNGRSLDFNGGGIEAKFGGSVKSPSLYWPGTPVYVQGLLGVSGTARIVWDGQRYVPGDLLSGFEVTLGADLPKFTLTAGVGCEDIKVAVGAKGSVAVHGELEPFRGLTTAKVNAPVGVKAFAKAFWLEIGVPIYSGTLPIYPRGENAVREAMPLSSATITGFRDFRRVAPLLPSLSVHGMRSSGGTLLEQIPDHGAIHAAGGTDGGIELLFLADDPVRASVDSATLNYAHVLNGALSSGSPEKVWDDGTADFHPSISAGTNGKVFAAWTNIKRAIVEADTFESFASNAEIAVAIRSSSGAWSHLNLTDDSAYDAAPSVAAAPDGSKALVAWSRNAKPLMYATPDSPDELRFSVWNGSVWSSPASVPSVAGSILSGSLAFNGTQGVYVYSVNPDFDGGCQTNVQLYATTYDGNAWSSPELLAENGFGPYDIHVWYAGSDWSVVWNCGGTVFYRKSPADMPVKIDDEADMTLGEVLAGAQVVGLTSSVAGAGENDREIAVSYLDPATGGWSSFAAVTDDGGAKSVSGGIRGSDGKLKLLYRERTEDCEDDYSKIRYTEVAPAAAVDFVADGMSVAENSYDIGSNVTIRVKMLNRGLLPSGDISVSLQTDSETLGPVVAKLQGGETCEVAFPWTVRTMDAPTMFVAKASDGHQMSQMLFKPDLAVDPPEMIEGIGERWLRARLRNLGLPAASDGTLVEFRLGDRTGELIGSARAGKIQYGVDGMYDVSVKWPSSVRAKAARQLVTVVIDPNGDVDEFYRDNNSRGAYVRSPLDTDGDGLVDDQEEMIGTDPTCRDTDNDGFSDYEESVVNHTCPTVSTYTVTFDLGRYGQPVEGQPTVQLIDHGGTAYQPEFTVEKGHVFIGWDVELPEEITSSLTLRAQYIPAPRNLTAISTRDPFAGAVEYLGWICDASGAMVGMLSVKVARAGKDGTAKAKATVTFLETGKKRTFVDVLPVGAATAIGKDALSGLKFTATGISGQFATGELSGYEATAVLNQTKSKDPAVTARFADFDGKVFTLSMTSYGAGSEQPFARGFGTLSVAFSKKGKAKVSGFLPDGSKVSSSVQLLLTNDGSCLPVFYSKSGKSRFAFALWFANGANLVNEPLTNASSWKTAQVGDGVSWHPTGISGIRAYEPPTHLSIKKFSVTAVDAETWFGQLIAFPFDVPITVSANLKKWDAGKAASLKLKDGVVTGADDPAKPNLTGLKLTFTPKNGTFKGSFSAVSLSESGPKPKLVKGKATVNGVLVDKTGYGTAVIKKTGSMPVTVK